MNQVQHRLAAITCAAAALALLAACSSSTVTSSVIGNGNGSGGGQTSEQITGIATPSSVSVVTATNAN